MFSPDNMPAAQIQPKGMLWRTKSMTPIFAIHTKESRLGEK
jgi:hypothetical protein